MTQNKDSTEKPRHAPHEIEEAVREKLRRNAIDAAHFFGLAALYEERGKRQQAAECLEIACSKDAGNPFAHKLYGKILFRRQMFNAAAVELRKARRFNPFDRETAELLGRVEYERERYREALESTIDAFLLVEEDDRTNGDRLKKRIRTLKSLQRLTSPLLAELFRERRDKLQTDFDRLEWQRDQFLRQEMPASFEDDDEERPRGGQLHFANRLRKLDMWSSLTDDQVFHLSRAARAESHPEGTRIFDYGSRGADIYALEEGEIGIYRPSSYGHFHLGTLPPGSVFGEVNFISRGHRSGDAVALSEVHILRLDAPELELVIEEQPELGARIYEMFWQDLAKKLRGANEQLRTFFPATAAPENFLKVRRELETTAEAAAKPAEAKSSDASPSAGADGIELLRQQGLSGAELEALAEIARVESFAAGAALFNEGDAGQEMYAILEGEVRISKYIEGGGGEEALAILRRGDFFGEMALIDGEPRSADARAHEGPAKVLVFDEKVLGRVRAMDAVTALDFLKLLCRLLAKRLREIDEKVTTWRIMSGSRSEEGAGFVEGPPATAARAANT